MSMPSNSNFHENSTPDAEPEGVAGSHVASTEDTPPAAVVALESSDITLHDRLAAMRMLSLKSTAHTPVNNILLHIFLFPQRITRLASTRVSVTSYLQDVGDHDLACEKQAMECVGSLGQDVFLTLTLDDLLIFPWFLLTQEKLIELDSSLKVSNIWSHALLNKMPQTFFKEFKSRHPEFREFLTGALRNLMNQKADNLTHKKQRSDRYIKKKQTKRLQVTPKDRLQQPINLSTQPRRQWHMPSVPASVPVHMPSVPASVPVPIPPSVPASVFPVRMPTRAPLLATSAGMTYAPPFTTGMGEGMQQPGMFMQQPGMFMQQPGMSMQQPGMSMQQPEMFMQQPGMFMQQPGMFMQPPGMFMQPPGMFIQQPGMFMQQPGMFMQQEVSESDLFNNRPPIAPAYMASAYQSATHSSGPPGALAEADRTLAETSSLKRFLR